MGNTSGIILFTFNYEVPGILCLDRLGNLREVLHKERIVSILSKLGLEILD